MGRVRVKSPLPSSEEGWLDEVARAYRDACETIPFGPAAGVEIRAKDLFHLGPVTCLKLRGIARTKRVLKRATDAALTSYVATESQGAATLRRPHLAFAFAYLASHFGLDLLEPEEVGTIMEYREEHEDRLLALIRG